MDTSVVHRSAAILVALAITTGCTDRSATGPAEGERESPAFASARKPLHETELIPFSTEFPCGSFTGVTAGQITQHLTTFFNAAGDPIRLHYHLVYDSAITNLTTGKTLTDNSNYIATVDLITGFVVANGVVYNVKDAETGIRIKDIGRLVFDAEGNIVFEAGRHDVNGFDDATEQYCAVLS
jgi:hypothetical protein